MASFPLHARTSAVDSLHRSCTAGIVTQCPLFGRVHDASSDTSRKKQEEECPCLIMMVEMDDFIGRELWPWLNHWKWELVEHFWAVESVAQVRSQRSRLAFSDDGCCYSQSLNIDGACRALHFGPSIISARPLFAKIGEQHDGYMYLRTSRALPDGCAISAVVVGQFRRGSSDLPVGIVGVCARTLAVGARIISVVGCCCCRSW